MDGSGDGSTEADSVEYDGGDGMDDNIFLHEVDDNSDELDDDPKSDYDDEIDVEEYVLEAENDQLFSTQLSLLQ